MMITAVDYNMDIRKLQSCFSSNESVQIGQQVEIRVQYTFRTGFVRIYFMMHLSVLAGGHYPADEIAKVMHEHNKKAHDVEYKYTADLEIKKVTYTVIKKQKPSPTYRLHSQ